MPLASASMVPPRLRRGRMSERTSSVMQTAARAQATTAATRAAYNCCCAAAAAAAWGYDTTTLQGAVPSSTVTGAYRWAQP